MTEVGAGKREDGDELLRRLADDDEDALRSLLVKYGPMVMAIADSILPSPVGAVTPEDVLQVVALRLWNRRRSVASLRSAGGIMKTLARDVSLAERRRMLRRAGLWQIKGTQERTTPFGDDSLTIREIQRVLESWSASDRYLIEMVSWGMSFRELATETGRSTDALRMHVSRLRRRLRQELRLDLVKDD